MVTAADSGNEQTGNGQNAGSGSPSNVMEVCSKYFERIVTHSLRQKPETVRKFMNEPSENLNAVVRFIEQPEDAAYYEEDSSDDSEEKSASSGLTAGNDSACVAKVSLYFYLNDKGGLEAANIFPQKFKNKCLAFTWAVHPKQISQGQKYWDYINYASYTPDVERCVLAHLDLVMDRIKHKAKVNKWPSILEHELQKEVMIAKRELKACIARDSDQILIEIPYQVESKFMSKEPLDYEDIKMLEGAYQEWFDCIKCKFLETFSSYLTDDQKKVTQDSKFRLLSSVMPEHMMSFYEKMEEDFLIIQQELTCIEQKNLNQIFIDKVQENQIAAHNAYPQLVSSLEKAINFIKQINKHFLVFKKTLGDFEKCDYEDSKENIRKIILGLLHIGNKSPNIFKRSPMIFSYLNCVSNFLIQATKEFLDPAGLLNGEYSDSIVKINHAIDKLTYYIKYIEINKEEILKVNCDTKEPCQADGTEAQDNILVIAEDKVLFNVKRHLKRLTKIKEILDSSQCFMRLERIELGGVNGEKLNKRIEKSWAMFQKIQKNIGDYESDPLDMNSDTFNAVYQTFNEDIKKLELILCKIFYDAMSNCNLSEPLHRIWVIMGDIASRDSMKNTLNIEYSRLVDIAMKDLGEVRKILDHHNEQDEVSQQHLYDKNMGFVTGVIRYFKDMQCRVTRNQKILSEWRGISSQSSLEKEKLDLYEKLVTDLFTKMDDYSECRLKAWLATVEDSCAVNLNGKLLTKTSNDAICVNFDDQLTEIIKEAHYLVDMDYTDRIPKCVTELYQKREHLRECVSVLKSGIACYNHVKHSLIDVEKHLMKRDIDTVEEKIEKGLATLNWESTECWAFIKSLNQDCQSLKTKTDTAQANLRLIFDEIDKIMHLGPMFFRKEGKLDGFLVFDDVDDKSKVRMSKIEEANRAIVDLFSKNKQLLLSSENSANWDEYAEYAKNKITKKLKNLVAYNLAYICKNLSIQDFSDQQYTDFGLDRSKFSDKPFLECQMVLQASELKFSPSAEEAHTNSICKKIESILNYIVNQAEGIKQLDNKTPDESFKSILEKDETIEKLLKATREKTRSILQQALDYQKQFMEFSKFWIDDKTKYVEELFNSGRKTHELNEEYTSRLSYFEDIVGKINGLNDVKIIDQSFKIDLKPFKQAMSSILYRWIRSFKDAIIKKVKDSIEEITLFFKDSKAGLAAEVQDSDYDGLVLVMSHLLNVKERQSLFEEEFVELKKTLKILSDFKEEFSDEILKSVTNLPERWDEIKKLSGTTKQKVSSLQANEVAQIRRKIMAFDVKQHEFRDVFRAMPAFLSNCQGPYKVLDDYNAQIEELEEYMSELTKAANLFEVNMPEFKMIKNCRNEIIVLKKIWDLRSYIESCFNQWKASSWLSIDLEQIEEECKGFSKILRTKIDKEARAWDSYSYLEESVKNMGASLKAVAELQHPSIKGRHWQQLVKATGIKFRPPSETEDTILDELLALQLHKFEDEVRDIVDRASKEASMGKVIDEIKNTWKEMIFEFDEHPRTKTPMIRIGEEMVEILEDNQVQLQNMFSSKYISHFYEEVNDWQKKLGNVDQSMNLWLDLQRTWSHLESIFVGSEDIRKQLPEDSLRFEQIDIEFKEIANFIHTTKDVISSTNDSKVNNRMEGLKSELQLCEKALFEYLETKRLAFPRFYFVSSSDLLDILSNGNRPRIVANHLVKLFDSLAKLEFNSENDDQKAIGMYAKDGEYVKFDKLCDFSGHQVEVWLKLLLDRHCETIRHKMTEAVLSYEEKSRELWIKEFPAQVALAASQVWWSTEVNAAFIQLEEGQENALKDYNKKQINQLNNLINLLIGDLTKAERQKIMTICTIDVHARDVVAKMIANKIDNSQAFGWLSQLRHRWDDNARHCFANICDAEFQYKYEYLGNTPRLVVTPLTDRCYITLTQSLHLIMSGAPAGPAGTGKTETTKDLGRALGIMVYVFNCSEQMDYKSVGSIYKGLAQSGAWGCFDEFNRISVEVLSVVAVQVKCIQDAIKEKKKEFNFMGEVISLDRSVGIFITMNPGYAGRTELPENLKALFRPCAMVVPDFELICEIMLVAEGFLDARLLARKFITLYRLCKELLSKQDHYDWGLRAIKSVLVVAGSLKRSDPTRPEDQVLMRALRDFNVPKIVTDDMPVFLGLIGDLFPSLSVPRKRDSEFEAEVRKAAQDLHYQPEEGFVLKVVQLKELFEVRHSVFVIGNAGTGKSSVWKTLNRTYQNLKMKPSYVDLNPKAVTNDELYGVINPSTREWKDGLFSTIMRDLAQSAANSDGPKWIVLDGDIDPMWIESLNTVMDDNKVLTLASNERISLTNSMRLLFEISHLKTATPATVSRAGILFINAADLGWAPYISSWIDSRTIQSEKANLTILTDRYVPACIEAIKTRFKKIIPISEIAHVQMLCNLLEMLLIPENTPQDCPKDVYEQYFIFACIWAFGSCLFKDQLKDHRVEFSNWWVSEFKTIKLPPTGTVFDYYIDPETNKFEPWSQMISPFSLDPDIPLQATLVSTAETARARFFMDNFVQQSKPIMFVGFAGVGKTVMVQQKLKSLPQEKYIVSNVPFNFYTTSAMLQAVLEKPLEKKAGRKYAPVGTKQLVYFIDDMNIPEVDQYFTVQPHTLLRQHLDYAHWYDRQKLSLKEILNTQYVSCMNPTAGSFTISPRLQRHFGVFAIDSPSRSSLETIYGSIMTLYADHLNLSQDLKAATESIVSIALDFHEKIQKHFLPTAIKFHYTFNLRDLSNIFQGMLYMSKNSIQTKVDYLSILAHECSRVYADKFVDLDDLKTYDHLMTEVCNSKMPGETKEMLTLNDSKPLIFTHFSKSLTEKDYTRVDSWDSLHKNLSESLENYNETNAAMNLVLFEDAMKYVCKINRILEGPRGNALLVGVGGSGKQSLARLAAAISGLEVFQITLKKGYSIVDLKADVMSLCLKVTLKNTPSMFLITDSQVADEKFLVVINDLLASGEVPDLIPDEEVENIMNAMRPQLKSLGIEDSRENLWAHYVAKLRNNLKIVTCMSPVGPLLRQRSRKFPALISCSNIIWFHEWPKTALFSVAKNFLSDIESFDQKVSEGLAEMMSLIAGSVSDSSEIFLKESRRYNYTTPKSFLEMIKLYKTIYAKKSRQLRNQIERLENGLEKLHSTSNQVDELKGKLAAQEVELAQKTKDANDLISVVGVETEKVTAEKIKADAEEAKVQKISEEVSKKQTDCEEDLAKAEPALIAAQEALNTLNKANLTELKAFGTPPPAVVTVLSGVMILLAPNGKVPKDLSWKAAKSTVMSKVDEFLNNLVNYNKENIHENCLKAIRPILKNPEFDPEFIKSKSSAAAGLCSWAINIVTFYDIFCDVEPKRNALAAANAELAAANEKLVEVRTKINGLEESLAKLTAKFEKATSEKMKCQQEAESTQQTVQLANRLVNGLASEKVRWAESIHSLQEQERSLPGDVMLITAFVSYLGYFTKQYRTDLMEKSWVPMLKKMMNKQILSYTENIDPIKMLTNAADIAAWNNNELPSDRMSTENATILLNSERWPLMVDPQLQGIKWLRNMYGDKLKSIRLDQKGYLDNLERVISNGDVAIIENLGEDIDPVLEPIIGRNTIKKGRAIKLGDKEIEYNQNFRLILHTKLANPHYKPEIQAQCALVNFSVTRDGLEDQLLADVVIKERPDLERIKADLTRQQNEFKILLSKLEDQLLAKLSSAEGDFLGDTSLVENLEQTKTTALEVEEKVIEAKKTEKEINEARELYRPIATRGSLLYFCIDSLDKIHPMYRFSLKSFRKVFERALDLCEASKDDLNLRSTQLISDVTKAVFVYTSRALFEKDKLVFTTQMCLQILITAGKIKLDEVETFLRFPVMPNCQSPVDFLQGQNWGAIKALSEISSFKNLDKDIEGSAKRWKKFTECESPEQEKLPQDWKNKSTIERMCILRAVRPDRLSYALKNFISEFLDPFYVQGDSIPFDQSFKETDPSTPMFFILSPGVDPLKDVEILGRKLGFGWNNSNFHNISLGQGQEIVAENALSLAAKSGHWVILQNIHLVAKWLPKLDKLLEEYSEGEVNENFRVFISAEPAGTPEAHIIPQSILENSIKITNEPPTGMQANLHKALSNFNNDTLESCSKDNEFRSILFTLCYFHAVVSERRKFGPQGWNRSYPFNTGDLTISVNVLLNYLETNAKVPWEDLRYLFGEIMYGGHITDDWDRRVANTYLLEYMRQEMFDSEIHLSSGFPVPAGQALDINGFHTYIDDFLPSESPVLYGLHPNAEIEFLTAMSDKMMKTVFEGQASFMAELSQKSLTQAGGGSDKDSAETVKDEEPVHVQTKEEKIKSLLDELLEKLPEEFNMMDIYSKVPVEERTPYAIVAIQEAERMNGLLKEISSSLKELNLGLKGELSMSSDMEKLGHSLFMDQVPQRWESKAYPSLLALSPWFIDLIARCKELEAWCEDLTQLPSTVWIGALFNPQAFLTAIMQQTARKNQWPLDKMCLQAEVMKKHNREEISSAPREGAYLYGLILEGARWEASQNSLAESHLKDLNPALPIVFVKAVPVEKADTRGTYACPMYKTKQRGPTFVWTLNLRSKDKPSKWTLGGVAMLLQI